MQNKPYYDANKLFYICSYGGCGSKMFTNYCRYFGQGFHIHSRKPPTLLTYPRNEGFDDKKLVPEELAKDAKVIYLFKDPVKAVESRFDTPQHLRNIQCPVTTWTKNDVITQKKDLYGLEEFFDNYTTPDPERNYKIVCIKYEAMFSDIEKVNEALGIPTVKEYLPKKSERNRTQYEELKTIYKNLNDKMDKMDLITII